MAVLLQRPRYQALTSLGTLAAGYLLYSYEAGTTTPLATYTTRTEDVEHTNPIVLDARGEAAVYVDGSKLYKFVLATPAGVVVTTDEDVGFTSAGMSFLQDGSGAESITVESKLRKIKSITDYGASTSNSAAVNTTKIQLAINANYGKSLRIPPGTFEVATTGQTDSSAAAVGDALTITDEINLVFEGIVKGTNNCNVFKIAAGSADVVTFFHEGGGIQGYGSFVTASTPPLSGGNNKGGALWAVTGGIFRCYQMRLIDPPQYCGWAENVDEGEVSECELIGGPTTYTDDNHFGICLFDEATGWKITDNKTLLNGTGRVVQAVGSVTLTTGTADRTLIRGNRFFNQWEKGTYIFGSDIQINNNWIHNCLNGEGIRVVGARAQVNNNVIRSCVGGGIGLFDAAGVQCHDNTISEYESVGILLGYYAAVAGKSLDNASIRDNKITGKTTGTNLYEAISIRGHANDDTTESRIAVVGNDIVTADYSTEDRGAIRFLPDGAGGTIFEHLRCENNTVFGCGSYGIRFAAGVYNYARCAGNKVHNPGIAFASPGRSAYRWDTAVTWTGQQISDNEAYNDGAGFMSYGFENVTSGGVVSTLIRGNHARNHVTAGYLNMQDASNSRYENRMGDNALHGTFTMEGDASITITNSNAQAGMRVKLIPTNASAQALQAGNNGLILGAITDGTNFALGTGAGGSAAGTETFVYEIDV
jgi:hypothetical protein